MWGVGKCGLLCSELLVLFALKGCTKGTLVFGVLQAEPNAAACRRMALKRNSCTSNNLKL